MALTLDMPELKYFNISSPLEYVAHVEINRPDKLNSFFQAMWQELRQVFETLSVSPTVRAIVFTGAGAKAFTAGLDVQAAAQSGVLAADAENSDLDAARAATLIRRQLLQFQDCITAIERAKSQSSVFCMDILMA